MTQQRRSLPLQSHEWQRLEELAVETGSVATRGRTAGEPSWRNLVKRIANGSLMLDRELENCYNMDMAKMGFTYFIADSHGHVKIGRTKNVASRFIDFQLAHAMPLVLLAAVPDGTIEKYAHKRFGHLRISGEWFRAGEGLLNFIDALGCKPLGKEAVERLAKKESLILHSRNRICDSCDKKNATRVNYNSDMEFKVLCERCHTMEVSGFVTKVKVLLLKGVDNGAET